MSTAWIAWEYEAHQHLWFARVKGNQQAARTALITRFFKNIDAQRQWAERSIESSDGDNLHPWIEQSPHHWPELGLPDSAVGKMLASSAAVPGGMAFFNSGPSPESPLYRPNTGNKDAPVIDTQIMDTQITSPEAEYHWSTQEPQWTELPESFYDQQLEQEDAPQLDDDDIY